MSTVIPTVGAQFGCVHEYSDGGRHFCADTASGEAEETSDKGLWQWATAPIGLKTCNNDNICIIFRFNKLMGEGITHVIFLRTLIDFTAYVIVPFVIYWVWDAVEKTYCTNTVIFNSQSKLA